jgi:hypothetical protein
MRFLFRNGLKAPIIFELLRIVASCGLMALMLAIGIPVRAQLQANQQIPSAKYTIGAQGAYYRVWQNVMPFTTNAQGQVTYRTNSYTELATGLNHLVNGQWVPSVQAIQITPTGGIATNGQHQVGFAANINTADAIEIITPDGKDLQTHIMGLSYYDASTDNNVLFAELQGSTGQLVTSNQVVYPNAFTDCDADVQYTYTLAGIEQDIVIQRQLPAPSAYGLNPDTTWLEVWTEFTDPPTPAIEQVLDGADERLDFGEMKIERGKAFIIGGETNPVPVNKAWTVAQGRTFLVEQVQFDTIANQLQSLQPYNGSGTGYQPIRNFPEQLPPKPTLAGRSTGSLKLAKTHAQEKGLVLDYSLTGSITNLTLQGDVTYLVSGSANLYSNTTIEGGTVVKYSNGPSIASLNIYGPVHCETGPYRMAVFTAMDDDTVGGYIYGSTGHPSGTYSLYAINNGYASNVFSYLRFCYSDYAYNEGSGSTTYLRHCQFVNNTTAVEDLSGTLNLENLLICNTSGYAFYGVNSTITGINLTVDHAGTLFYDSFNSTLSLTNCLLTAITSAGSSHGGTNNFTNNVGGVYQTAGAGAHYLADGSPYRNAGITNIDPTLLADLQNLTTYPPLLFNTNTYTANTTLYPQAQRDYDTPDLGYHYAPLDYLGTYVVTNATLTLTNGVVLGQTNQDMIWLQNGSQFVSQGTPNEHNGLIFYTLVQEQPTNLSGQYPWVAGSSPIYAYDTNHSSSPNVFLRFTTIALPDSDVYGTGSYIIGTDSSDYAINAFTMKDSEVYAAEEQWIFQPTSGNTITLGNNVFQYVQFLETSGGTQSAYNNLFTGVDSYVEFDDGTLQNNAFDGCANGVYLPTTRSNTAYLNMNPLAIEQPVLANDIVTNLTWVSWILGNYYQATNSPLLHKGSTAADQLGLYHYTVTTNETPETTNIVSIGYHYVALGTNGLPLDTSGNGPDYLLDANGNGVVDSGEISWTNAGDLGLQVIITKPPNNSTLP